MTGGPAVWGGLTITLDDTGTTLFTGTTLVDGLLVDQAAVHAV